MSHRCACLWQGRRAATCTDNITDVSSRDEQSDAAQFVNSVDSFICQSTIIPADGRGFRMAISSQSVSLADIFIGKMLVSKRQWGQQLLMSPLSFVSRHDSRHRPGQRERQTGSFSWNLKYRSRCQLLLQVQQDRRSASTHVVQYICSNRYFFQVKTGNGIMWSGS